MNLSCPLEKDLTSRDFEMENRQPASSTLKVSTGVTKRFIKELEMYRKEVEEGQAKLESLPTSDNFYSQTREALQESKTMYTKTQESLRRALAELDSKLKGIETESSEKEEAVNWAEKARTVLSTFA